MIYYSVSSFWHAHLNLYSFSDNWSPLNVLQAVQIVRDEFYINLIQHQQRYAIVLRMCGSSRKSVLGATFICIHVAWISNWHTKIIFRAQLRLWSDCGMNFQISSIAFYTTLETKQLEYYLDWALRKTNFKRLKM